MTDKTIGGTEQNPTILIIDDDVNFLFSLSPLLAKEGFSVLAATDGISGIARAQSKHPDIILMDVNMPKMTGFQVKKVLESDRITQYIPVVFLTAMNDDSEIHTEISTPEDYITKPINITILTARIKSVLRNPKTGMNRTNLESDTLYHFERFKQWAYSVEMLDERLVGHTTRVAKLTVVLAKSLGIEDEVELENIYKGAFLHDIGKLSISERIMNKPGPLSENEWKIMHQHPVVAYQMLNPISILKDSLEIPYAHHERWDGNGYPNQLSGESIPLSARIFSVADVYDALTSKHPYKEANSEEKSLSIIKSLSGKQLDPAIVDHFLEHFKEIKEQTTIDHNNHDPFA
jgi:putative two-component system response regulator